MSFHNPIPLKSWKLTIVYQHDLNISFADEVVGQNTFISDQINLILKVKYESCIKPCKKAILITILPTHFLQIAIADIWRWKMATQLFLPSSDSLTSPSDLWAKPSYVRDGPGSPAENTQRAAAGKAVTDRHLVFFLLWGVGCPLSTFCRQRNPPRKSSDLSL